MPFILFNKETNEVTNIYYDQDNAPDEVKSSWILTSAIPDAPALPEGSSSILCYDPSASQLYYKTISMYTLTEVQAAKIAQFEQNYIKEIGAGFVSSALGTGHTYPADSEAQLNIQIVIKRLEIGEKQAQAAGVDLTNPANRPTFEYLTLDAGALPHNLDQIEQVFADGVDAASPTLTKLRDRRAQVEAATTIEEVNAITW